MQGKILEVADKLFHKFGARSVSMDDIAADLSISKKTIYQFYKDKDEIVTLVTKAAIYKEMDRFEKVKEESKDAIEEIFNLSKCLRKSIGEVNPSLLHDLKKYHPEAWVLWVEFKSGFIQNAILDTIIQGKTEGYFRQNINASILAKFRVESVEMAFNADIFPTNEYDFTEVQMALFDHFVHGLMTIEGHKIYEGLITSMINENN